MNAALIVYLDFATGFDRGVSLFLEQIQLIEGHSRNGKTVYIDDRRDDRKSLPNRAIKRRRERTLSLRKWCLTTDQQDSMGLTSGK
jgi:hypothetical protein